MPRSAGWALLFLPDERPLGAVQPRSSTACCTTATSSNIRGNSCRMREDQELRHSMQRTDAARKPAGPPPRDRCDDGRRTGTRKSIGGRHDPRRRPQCVQFSIAIDRSCAEGDLPSIPHASELRGMSLNRTVLALLLNALGVPNQAVRLEGGGIQAVRGSRGAARRGRRADVAVNLLYLRRLRVQQLPVGPGKWPSLKL